MIYLTIKGNASEAEQAASERGLNIALRGVTADPYTLASVDGTREQWRVVMAWFCEESGSGGPLTARAPFPIGTLLHYGNTESTP